MSAIGPELPWPTSDWHGSYRVISGRMQVAHVLLAAFFMTKTVSERSAATPAPPGKELFEDSKTFTCDATSVVIAHVQMPAMSGVELQALLLAQGHRVPFIFITAFPEETIREQAMKAGAICFLTKPFDRPTLIKCLDTALKRHGGGTDK